MSQKVKNRFFSLDRYAVKFIPFISDGGLFQTDFKLKDNRKIAVNSQNTTKSAKKMSKITTPNMKPCQKIVKNIHR